MSARQSPLPAHFGRALARRIGARLRAARHARGLTRNAVAAEIGSHGPVVTRTELGKHAPTMAVLAHAEAVGVSAADVFALIDAELEAFGVRPGHEGRRISARADAARILDEWRARAM